MYNLSTSVVQRQKNAEVVTGFERRLTRASVRRVNAKELVFVQGDPATHLFQVEVGVIAVYKVLFDGRRLIVAFAYPGDFIGLGAQGEHLINAQAITASRLRCLLIAPLYQSAREDPALAFQLYEASTRELAASRDLMLATAQRNAKERVAVFLLAFSRRNAHNGLNSINIELPMSRADIGDFLGLTFETVSRSFTKLKCMGLIELPHSNLVKLLNVDELTKITEGEDRNSQRCTRLHRRENILIH